MMSPFKWIKTSLFLLLLLQFAAVGGEYFSIIVRGGDEVTLPSVNVKQHQDKCDRTNWFINRFGNPVDLVTDGKIKEEATTASDKLRVTENCSLVIKNVSEQDVGPYHCLSGHETQYLLSMINMNKQDDGEQVKLSCLVSTHTLYMCQHTVTWTYEGEKGEDDIAYADMQTTQYQCSVMVTFPASKSKHLELFKCKVEDGYNKKELLFPFIPPQASDLDATTAKTSTTRITDSSTKSRSSSTVPAVSFTSTKLKGWWPYILAAVGLAALLTIIIVAVIGWKRTKGNRTQLDDNTGQSLNPAVNQPGAETSQDTADPEDGVAYASVSYKKKSNSRAQVQVRNDDDDDEGDSVTYSTVKASSASVGASAAPSDLYASVRKGKK
ncbi:uncharacterized protein LOC131990735 [Centropristis striata]|uniref:uncharacterized protein LOC131990735 n=1 Tax=Centropristis striata TaxID=184440 RepID=UPI0027DFEF38|nr:uncharacterized protein LOC131990735 [Centropristis striata]